MEVHVACEEEGRNVVEGSDHIQEDRDDMVADNENNLAEDHVAYEAVARNVRNGYVCHSYLEMAYHVHVVEGNEAQVQTTSHHLPVIEMENAYQDLEEAYLVRNNPLDDRDASLVAADEAVVAAVVHDHYSNYLLDLNLTRVGLLLRCCLLLDYVGLPC